MTCKMLAGLGLSLVLAIPVFAKSGGFDLDFFNGTAWVSQHQFTDPTTVYLGGGTGLTDGQYYFAVTDSSGHTILSTDDQSCRVIVVSGGVVAGVPAGTPPAACTGGSYHVVASAADGNGGFPVQMGPFTTGGSSVYKAYITPVTTPFTGFKANSSSKITFKVNCTTDCGTPPPPQSMIGGTKYFDVNAANTTDPTKPLAGILDTVHDPLLSMWTINIYNGTDTTQPPIDTETTDVSGAWSTFVNQGAEITVCEVLTTGWTQSGPSPSLYSTMAYSTYPPPGNVVPDLSTTDGGGHCWQLTSVGTTSITGLDFGNYLQITGKKQYNLTSADSGTGIPNWPITIACDPTATTAGYCQNPSVITDANGNYVYKPTGPVTSYLVCEGTETTWTQSYPTGSTPAVNGATVDTVDCANKTVGWAGLVGTATGGGLDFSNYATINGTKFYSGTTTGLSGWTISLGSTTTVTGTNGKYSINVPTFPFAATNVCETLQTGWTEVTPNPATNNGCYSYALTGLTPSVTPAASTLDFYNNIQISGAKYYDPTGSGAGTGVSGVTINIAYTPVGGTATSTTTTTGTGGVYNFTFPVPVSTYTVTETVPTGWTQSYPPSGSYTRTPGSSVGTGLNFGNYVAVSGAKLYAGTATTLNGWTINLKNSVPTTVATTTTAGAGAYSLVIPTYPFTGSICEVAQTGWTEISPSPTTNSGCYPISLSGLTVPSGPFNFQNAIILSGTKFYDVNLDKTQDNGELGIGGFKIGIYSCLGSGCTLSTTPSYTYTTAPNGTFTWTAPAPGITSFKVCEVLPPTGNWTETTTPACYTGTVGTSPQTGLTFGNVCEGVGVSAYGQGFWHNKNGQAVLTSPLNYPGWATWMNGFNNNTDSGWTGFLSFVPTTTLTYGLTSFTGTNALNDYTEIALNLFTTTNAKNAANMLSTQLATMELNTVVKGSITGQPAPNVSSTALMQVGTAAALTANGCTASLGVVPLVVNGAGYATTGSVESYANTLLLLAPNTTGSGAMRSCQNFIQNALDNANSNNPLSIIQPTACTVPTY